MARRPEGRDIAQEGNPKVSADYGQRAAMALDRCIRGPHRDKQVAQLFGVSVRFAKYLRSGQCWTTERLTQASRALQGFDEYLSAPNIHARLDELQAEIAFLRQHVRGEEE